MTCRPHALYVWYGSRTWCLLLLLPFVRALLFGQSGVELWRDSVQDTALAVTLVAVTWLRWRSTRYTLHKGLRTCQQFLWRHRVWVLAEDAASMEVERSPLMALTGCRRITLFTAGIRRRADASALLPRRQAEALLRNRPEADGKPCVNGFAVWVMALSGSNGAVGLLTLAPVARQAARLFREEAAQLTGLLGRMIERGLPQLLHAAAMLLLGGWIYASLRQWLRFYRFRVCRSGQTLTIRSGLITRRDVYIDCGKITTLELRRNLPMYWLRLFTATITAAGYGRERGMRPVLIPAARQQRLCTLLDRFLPGFPVCPKRIRPLPGALRRELLPPFAGWMAFTALWLWYPNVFCLWAAAGFAWWMLVRAIGFSKSGVGVDRRAVSLCYVRGLALYEVHIPRETADSITLTQSPLQQRRGTCNVTVRTYGEKYRRHRVRGIRREDALRLAEDFCRPM